MRFMVIMHPGSPGAEAGEMPQSEHIAAMMRFNEELAQAGILLGADGLQPSSRGARVRFSGGQPAVTDGPFTESKEIIGGFWMWNIASLEEAVAWASRCPAEEGDMLEIRQVFEVADFGEAVCPEAAALIDRVGKQMEENQGAVSA